MSYQPSPRQLEALAALPQGRELLLQCHWKWAGKALDPTVITDCFSVFRQLDIKLVSQSRVDLLAVGEASCDWSEIWLLQIPGPVEAAGLMSTPAMQALLNSAEAVEVIVASLPHPRLRRMISLLNRFVPWLPAPRRGDTIHDELLNGGINPTTAQSAEFQSANQGCPIHMFNLLRFHPRAEYANGDRGFTGQQAYEQGYGRVAMSCVLRLGGRIAAFGRYRLTLVGAEGDPATDAWDEIAVVQYPNRPAFTHMISNPGYIAALEHRNAGLAQTQLWSAEPLPDYVR